MDYCLFDIEADNLLEDITKIHCVSVNRFVSGQSVEKFNIIDYDQMRYFFLGEKVLVGHNIIRYDIPAVEKILNIEVKARQIDTLAISWYLTPNFKKHGLEDWGERLGTAKVPIEDWVNLPVETYIERCSTDVEINVKLFDQQLQHLSKIYDGKFDKFLYYLTFKMKCAREQEEVKWRLDVEKAQEGLDYLISEKTPKIEALKTVMPKIIKYKQVSKPKVTVIKDGSISAAGAKWYHLLGQKGLPIDYNGTVQVKVSEEEPNPTSPKQIKDYLFSLGWKPTIFTYPRDKVTGDVRALPQVQKDDQICENIKSLYERVPELQNLESLAIISHRIGILSGFLENADQAGFLKAEIAGLTNTLRFKHKTIVNLPTIHKPYGDRIRCCLIAPDDDHVLCGSDMSSLEDNTKQHYMYYYDPKYVEEMRTPGFSPHLDIGVQGDMITVEESNFYIWYDAKHANDTLVASLYYPRVHKRYLELTEEQQKEEFKKIGKVRKDAKVVNFSAVYGVGAPKMSLTTGWPLNKSQGLLKIYWKRNWSVKKIAKDVTSKTIDGQMWLYNPVSTFWYSLRYEKDKFSTLNQGTGVYCFDTQVKHIRKKGYKMCGQFHDEIVFPVLKGIEEQVKTDLNACIEQTNRELKLNIKLGISMDFGHRYSDIH